MAAVTYKKAIELRSKDRVVLPNDVVRTVAGKLLTKEKVLVTFVGGAERIFNHQDVMKVQVNRENLGVKVPDYIAKACYYAK